MNTKYTKMVHTVGTSEITSSKKFEATLKEMYLQYTKDTDNYIIYNMHPDDFYKLAYDYSIGNAHCGYIYDGGCIYETITIVDNIINRTSERLSEFPVDTSANPFDAGRDFPELEVYVNKSIDSVVPTTRVVERHGVAYILENKETMDDPTSTDEFKEIGA